MLSTKERLCLERQKRRLRLLKITVSFLCFVCMVVGGYQLVHQPWFSFGNIDVVGNLQTFLQWHEMDPVNDFERTRNDRIFGIQNNRNPFIDHPELVNIYFGTGAQKLTVSINLVSTSITMLADYRRYQF